jgi:hypothetical protein
VGEPFVVKQFYGKHGKYHSIEYKNGEYREEPLIRCCKSGDLQTLQWLWNKSIQLDQPIDIHINNEEPFVECLVNNKSDMAQWLYKLANDTGKPIDMDVVDKFISKFYNYGNEQNFWVRIDNLDLIKWLTTIGFRQQVFKRIFNGLYQGYDLNSVMFLYNYLESIGAPIDWNTDINRYVNRPNPKELQTDIARWRKWIDSKRGRSCGRTLFYQYTSAS